MQRRIVIAGTGSGVGKTTLTLGLLAAYRAKGYEVQGFKCGPDYIDPTYHTAVTGRRSRNLDSWMMGESAVKSAYLRGSEGADLSVIEGVMGFYDGKNPLSDKGSTADISRLTRSPVILVVNCQSMARSAAAIVKGFQVFSNQVQIAGVIANQVGSPNHYKLIKMAVEQECGIPVVGYLPRDGEIEIPERHLGLVPSVERGELKGLFNMLAEKTAKTIDLDLLWQLSACDDLSRDEPVSNLSNRNPVHIRLAVAKDAAFHFYYPENLEMLEAAGAELVYFSPLSGEPVPEGVHGLYLGGGFPEEFAEQLAKQESVKQSVRNAIIQGMPSLAECGGYMYLAKSIETTDGRTYPMVGIIPGRVRMHTKSKALGYREIRGTEGNFLLAHDQLARGHEFHYSTLEPIDSEGFPPAYITQGMRGEKEDGYLSENLSAGYSHFHFASCPEMVHNWLRACDKYKKKRD